MHHRTSHTNKRRALGALAVFAIGALVPAVFAPVATAQSATSIVIFGPTGPIDEGAPIPFTVAAVNPPETGSIAVKLRTEALLSTASPGADYVAFTDRVVVLTDADDWIATTHVTTLNDDGLEGPEVVTVQVYSPSPEANRVLPYAAGVIGPNDLPGVPTVPIPQVGIPTIPDLGPFFRIPSFTVNDVRAIEGSGTTSAVEFTVTRHNNSLTPASVSYVTEDGTAVAGTDYEKRSGGLWFDIGEKTRTVSVPIVTDFVEEADKTFSLRLRTPIGAFISDGEGIATIVDDDAPPPPSSTGLPPAGQTTPDGGGYWLHDRTGQVFSFGNALRLAGIADFLSPHLANGIRVVAMAGSQNSNGAWLADNKGGVYALGSAEFYGSMPGLVNAGLVGSLPDVTDISATPAGDGYAILARDGGVFTFGNARFFGSLHTLVAQGQLERAPEAISMAYTPSGSGYWIVSADGGVFAFGDAQFHGSMPGLVARGVMSHVPRLVSIAPGPGGTGYILVDQHGGVFTFGATAFHGSVPGLVASKQIAHSVPVFGAEMTRTGNGYWIFGRTGGLYTFGDAPFFGATSFPDV